MLLLILSAAYLVRQVFATDTDIGVPDDMAGRYDVAPGIFESSGPWLYWTIIRDNGCEMQAPAAFNGAG